MGVVPDTRLQQLEFYEAHVPVWQDNAGAIGLTVGQLTALSTLVTAARTNYNAQQPARNAAKAATQAFYDSIDSAHENGSNLIAIIKTYAASTGNPGVYTTAEIPPPAAPSPAPPPSTPTGQQALLENNGSITIKWNVTQPAPGAGVYTAVLRQLNGSGAFVPLGDTGEKQFNDPTVPPGAQRVTYLLQARRSGIGGQSSPFSEPLTVFLGVPQDSDAGAQPLHIAA
ncbi:MAG: hypothetical protein ACKVU4_13105 [Phycisphaerales bacterium]